MRPLTRRRKALLICAAGLPILSMLTFGSHGLLKRISLEMAYNRAFDRLIALRVAPALRTRRLARG